MEATGYELVAIKRWWVPEWIFALAVYACRFIESDLSKHKWLSFFLVTKKFHYHDIGGVIRGERCRRCR